MKKNLGSVHRFIRLLLAILFAYLFFGERAEGVWRWISLALTALYLFTAVTGYAPLYGIFGKSTRRKE